MTARESWFRARQQGAPHCYPRRKTQRFLLFILLKNGLQRIGKQRKRCFFRIFRRFKCHAEHLCTPCPCKKENTAVYASVRLATCEYMPCIQHLAVSSHAAWASSRKLKIVLSLFYRDCCLCAIEHDLEHTLLIRAVQRYSMLLQQCQRFLIGMAVIISLTDGNDSDFR